MQRHAVRFSVASELEPVEPGCGTGGPGELAKATAAGIGAEGGTGDGDW